MYWDNVNKMIEECESWLDYTEYPPNSNNTIFGDWYGMNYEAWCDMFISYCGYMAGLESIIGHFCSCPKHMNWFIDRGQFINSEEIPQQGDIVFFSRTRYGVAAHVGIVTGYDDVEKSIHTIEGNTSLSSNDNGGAVMRRVRPIEGLEGLYIAGYGRPDYGRVDEMTDEDLERIIDEIPKYVWGYESRTGSSAINELANIKLRADANGAKLAELENRLASLERRIRDADI